MDTTNVLHSWLEAFPFGSGEASLTDTRDGRPGLWDRAKYLWPPNRRKLLDELVRQVAAGTVLPMAALATYERRTRLLPWRPILPPSSEPMYRLLLASTARQRPDAVPVPKITPVRPPRAETEH